MFALEQSFFYDMQFEFGSYLKNLSRYSSSNFENQPILTFQGQNFEFLAPKNRFIENPVILSNNQCLFFLDSSFLQHLQFEFRSYLKNSPSYDPSNFEKNAYTLTKVHTGERTRLKWP